MHRHQALADGEGRGRIRAELVIFENSSHMAFIEERAAYLRVIEDFLARAEARPGS